MVVIMGAVPGTPRIGFRHRRSISAPSSPVRSMVAPNAAPKTSTRLTPVNGWAFRP